MSLLGRWLVLVKAYSRSQWCGRAPRQAFIKIYEVFWSVGSSQFSGFHSCKQHLCFYAYNFWTNWAYKILVAQALTLFKLKRLVDNIGLNLCRWYWMNMYLTTCQWRGRKRRCFNCYLISNCGKVRCNLYPCSFMSAFVALEKTAKA